MPEFVLDHVWFMGKMAAQIQVPLSSDHVPCEMEISLTCRQGAFGEDLSEEGMRAKA
jgi:hypothetical protein